MNSEPQVRKAIRQAMLKEKSACDFYRLAARQMRTDEVREILERLSREERDHARGFFDLYDGGDLPDFDTFMGESPAFDADWLVDLERVLDPAMTEEEVLSLAMDRERRQEEFLRQALSGPEDPVVRAVYRLRAEETGEHYRRLQAEYDRLRRKNFSN